ncbi:hypothetical protein [Pengzhenrongella frigida]|uniref:Uncharacterized protein n=1 Tax=Pengzhenrongella frigida TaxID=1259133 RepID=A0A4Q5N5V6_9MICO|nr:hypothetical protein [Cellulomonas sp. HLT2-17]RYV51521.1 hypothetical protein EUA98_08020 [Cellulomonas sp. HLT2-17]
MTSFRIALGIGLLRPCIRPDVVLPAAADAARRMTTVESSDLAVVRGEARIDVRFTAEGNDEAARIARRVHAAVDALATVTAPDLSRRSGARWHPVPWRP